MSQERLILMKQKILIFTDSRGQHVPAGNNHTIFGQRLKNEVQNAEVDLVLCPMKWTTTLDFIEYANEHDLSKYDWIVLYTGVVEWSPRPSNSAINDLYNNKYEENINNWGNNTKDYSKKIVNNKKKIFDRVFGEKTIKKHLNTPFTTIYEGSRTNNMYSIEMAKESIVPILKKFNNLIFINTNRIVDGWEGDFTRGRPNNINIIHEYTDVISNAFPEDRLIDLRKWNDSQIKEMTCDNMHLTKKGSDYIMSKLVKKMDLQLKTEWETIKEKLQNKVEHDIEKLLDFKNIETYRKEKKNKFISKYTNKSYLATLIIGFRLRDDDPSRVDNLKFLLEWIEHYYEDMFDILIVEQDTEKKLDLKTLSSASNIRHEFIYNPLDYNRGWGYNVAVKHFCDDSDVVVLMDTDVLTGSNFVADVRDCLIGKYKVISPYQNIYYTDYNEVEKIKLDYSFNSLKNINNIKNPVTITGGVVIFDKNTYLELKGFEQYTGYSSEDRALDTMLL